MNIFKIISFFLDEFSSQDEDDDINGSRNSIQDASRRPASKVSMPKIISRCKAIYAYTPKLDDELEINPGSLRQCSTAFQLPPKFIFCLFFR